MSAPTVGEQLRRASDRLVTPAVVIVALVLGFLVLAGTAGAAVWAELHGGRGLVVIDTVTKALAALGSVAATTLLAVARHQLSRIEVAAAAAAAPATANMPANMPATTDSPEPAVEAPEPTVEAPEAPLDVPEPPAPARPRPLSRDDATGLIPVVRHRG